MVRTTAWICTHPCETACVRRIYDAPVALRALKRYAVEQVDPTPLAPRPIDARGEGYSIAVIGAGPAGLSAAHDLALLGYRVTAFEAREAAGGVPASLIPSFRLPAEVVAADVSDVERLGVEIRTGERVPTRPDELRAAGFDRVIVATGAPRGLGLDLPGARLPGVFDALALLRSMARGERSALGDRVVVVGGGDTAVDAARAVRRSGVSEVSIAFRKARIEGRARRQEAASAVAEGIHLRPGVIPVGIHGADRVRGLVLSAVVTYHDAMARYRPRARDGTKTILDADSVVVAVGRQQDEAAAALQGSSRPTDHGSALRIGDGWAAGGDVTGPGPLVQALADGQALARWVDRELTGEERRVSVNVRHASSVSMPSPQPAERHEPTTPAAASLEGSRCLNCWITVQFDEDGECAQCGRCAESCPGGALGAGVDDHSVPSPPAQPSWLDARSCLRCGLCVERCPAGCLQLVEVVEEATDRDG